MSLPWTFDAPIRTQRLVIRPMTPGDLDDVYAYQSDQDNHRYLLNDARSREEVVEAVGRYASARRLADEKDWIQPAVELDGRVIGQLFLTIVSVDNRGAEVGWVFHPDFQGRGYATEAATALFDLAFGELGMHRIRAELDPKNAASIALCRRLGMREEAFFVKDVWLRGRWDDSGIYAILEEEWAARRSL
ncbi:MAG TPA: GNAT family N-acetyltransferase [Pseudolysinimonas sp.]|nr:GNAT family N-acetyltransferase [Pseudolysinimonas sp.]